MILIKVTFSLLKVGYREPEGIEAKMRRSEGGEEREDAEDEAPTVVVLNKVNTLRGSPQSLSLYKYVKKNQSLQCNIK